MRLDDWEDQIADTTRRKRIDRDSTHRRVHRMSGLQRLSQCRRRKRLDTDNPHSSLEPREHSTDQAAAANGDQDRVEISRLILELHPERPLTDQRLDLIERMNGKRTR